MLRFTPAQQLGLLVLLTLLLGLAIFRAATAPW
jgi:hypothetical protein